MLRRIALALAALVAVPMLIPSGAEGDYTPALGRYIVVLNDSATPADAAEVMASATGLGATVNGLFGSVLHGLSVTLPILNLTNLRNDPRVAYIAPDRKVGLFKDAEAPVPNGISRIGAARFNDDGTFKAAAAPAAAVAIVDTGIAPHPDLNVVGGVNCASDPLGGLLGGLLGGGGSKAKEGDYADTHGHGTHVAGTVAALANGAGVVGVSPGTPLYAVRVFGALGTGNLSDVICGLDWVAANAAEKNIKVVNMSLGGTGVDDKTCGTDSKDPFHAAVCRVTAAGVTVVVAAGNSDVDLVETVPASYDEVLTVSAMADFDGLAGGLAQATCETKDMDDTAADFSNFTVGEDSAHMVAAPGVCINSTWKDGTYNTISGTSMASPHVAGLVARCIDAGPCAGLPPTDVIQKIRSFASARPAESGFMGDTQHPIETRYYGDLVDSSTF